MPSVRVRGKNQSVSFSQEHGSPYVANEPFLYQAIANVTSPYLPISPPPNPHPDFNPAVWDTLGHVLQSPHDPGLGLFPHTDQSDSDCNERKHSEEPQPHSASAVLGEREADAVSRGSGTSIRLEDDCAIVFAVQARKAD